MDYLLENLNLNNICFSSKSIWFLVAMGVLAVQSVILAVLIVNRLGFSLRFPSSSASIKRKKRADRKKKRAVNNTTTDNEKCLDWKVRMEIALGVARAVEYLQKKMKPSILHLCIEPFHLCIEPCNIWLGVNYTPKLSAYGMPMMYSREKGVAFPRQMIGSFCYGQPDYERTKNVTVETDIYGFGILLIKIITGKHEYLCGRDLHQKFLHWVQLYLKDKLKMVEMVDPKLRSNFELDELYEICDIAEACLNEQRKSRPSIVDLVKRMNHLGTPNDDL